MEVAVFCTGVHSGSAGVVFWRVRVGRLGVVTGWVSSDGSDLDLSLNAIAACRRVRSMSGRKAGVAAGCRRGSED